MAEFRAALRGANAGDVVKVAVDTFHDGSDQTLAVTAPAFPVTKLTGMFFADGRLFYTVNGDPRLYWRWFEPQSRIVGAQRFIASGNGDGLDWSAARGITMASGKLYYIRAGTLYAMDFASDAPVAGTETAISGTAAGDGQAWSGRGMFVNAP